MTRGSAKSSSVDVGVEIVSMPKYHVGVEIVSMPRGLAASQPASQPARQALNMSSSTALALNMQPTTFHGVGVEYESHDQERR